MVSYIQIGAIILAGISVAVADALIKRVSLNSNILLAFKNPFIILIFLLYLAQVFFFIYVFMNKWNLAIVGNLQMVFYSISVVLIGLLAFNERLTPIQIAGIVFSLIGVVLINL